MGKIQKISRLEPTIAFSEFEFYKQYQQSFQNSELGHIHQAIPFAGLVKSLRLKDNIRERDAYFPAEGKLGLMFLKSYTNFSDSQLIDNLNNNIHFQLFCGIRINPLEPLTNFKIVSAIRCEIASLMNTGELQNVLSNYWRPYMENLQVQMTDATCYETDIFVIQLI